MPDESATPLDGIIDAGQLFLLSGMIDQVRDAASELLDRDPDPATVDALADGYRLVRDQLPAVLSDDAGQLVATMTGPMDSAASIHHIFVRASLLARLLDLLVETPQMVLKRRLVHSETHRITGRIDAAANPAEVAEALSSMMSGPVPSAASDTAGNYL